MIKILSGNRHKRGRAVRLALIEASSPQSGRVSRLCERLRTFVQMGETPSE